MKKRIRLAADICTCWVSHTGVTKGLAFRSANRTGFIRLGRDCGIFEAKSYSTAMMSHGQMTNEISGKSKWQLAQLGGWHLDALEQHVSPAHPPRLHRLNSVTGLGGHCLRQFQGCGWLTHDFQSHKHPTHR